MQEGEKPGAPTFLHLRAASSCSYFCAAPFSSPPGVPGPSKFQQRVNSHLLLGRGPGRWTSKPTLQACQCGTAHLEPLCIQEAGHPLPQAPAQVSFNLGNLLPPPIHFLTPKTLLGSVICCCPSPGLLVPMELCFISLPPFHRGLGRDEINVCAQCSVSKKREKPQPTGSQAQPGRSGPVGPSGRGSSPLGLGRGEMVTAGGTVGLSFES